MTDSNDATRDQTYEGRVHCPCGWEKAETSRLEDAGAAHNRLLVAANAHAEGHFEEQDAKGR